MVGKPLILLQELVINECELHRSDVWQKVARHCERFGNAVSFVRDQRFHISLHFQAAAGSLLLRKACLCPALLSILLSPALSRVSRTSVSLSVY